MRLLIEETLAAGFMEDGVPTPGSIGLAAMDDGAALRLGDQWLVVTTDSHVIHPIFFPGGDIGRLAVAGTVNDLAVMGATRPLALTSAIIVEEGFRQADLARLQASMVETCREAGVTVVTVLTKPYPCPGKCIFCPTDVRMPKSYLYDEPGAQRAERHAFDPYNQTAARIQVLEQIGHPAEKIELLILGGTWSSYRRDYQEWFVKRCLDAMNGLESETLLEAQERNAVGPRRNVGLGVGKRLRATSIRGSRRCRRWSMQIP